MRIAGQPNAQKAVAKLKKNPKSSIPKLAEALQSTNKLANTHIIEILTDLASSATLEYYVPYLGNDVEVIRQGVSEALCKAENIDPNPLVPRLADPNLSKTAISKTNSSLTLVWVIICIVLTHLSNRRSPHGR